MDVEVVRECEFVNWFWSENAFCHKSSFFENVICKFLFLTYIYFKKNSIFGNANAKKSENYKKNLRMDAE